MSPPVPPETLGAMAEVSGFATGSLDTLPPADVARKAESVGVAKATASAVDLFVNRSAIVNNGSNGIRSEGAATARVRISDTTITGNATGLSIGAPAQVISFGNNRIDGNGVNGAPTSTIGEL